MLPRGTDGRCRLRQEEGADLGGYGKGAKVRLEGRKGVGGADFGETGPA